METETPRTTPILQIAWTRFSELDINSLVRSKSHLVKRRWIAALGVLATLFAILSQMFPVEREPVLLGWTFRIFLILIPLVASAMAAFTKAFYSSGDWLMMRAGAEEVQKEIYFFRTILQKEKDRRTYLENRLVEIQRQLYQSLNGELVLKPYHGPIPSNYYPSDPNSDPGFEDLTGEQYFKYRVENQLSWHRKEIQEYQAERIKLQILILVAGVVGALLYRMVDWLDSEEQQVSGEQRGRFVRLQQIMDWPAAQLMTLSLAIATDFDSVYQAWRRYHDEQGHGLFDGDSGFLLAAGRSVVLTGHAARDGYAELLSGPMISLQHAMDLTWRMLGVWLTVLALLLLVGVIV